MKTTLFILALLVSAVSWAGPDIPWPKASQLENGGKFLGYYTDYYDDSHFYSVAIEKNQTGYYNSQCPYILVIQEIDSFTGEVLNEHETYQCGQYRAKVSLARY